MSDCRVRPAVVNLAHVFVRIEDFTTVQYKKYPELSSLEKAITFPPSVRQDPATDGKNPNLTIVLKQERRQIRYSYSVKDKIVYRNQQLHSYYLMLTEKIYGVQILTKLLPRGKIILYFSVPLNPS